MKLNKKKKKKKRSTFVENWLFGEMEWEKAIEHDSITIDSSNNNINGDHNTPRRVGSIRGCRTMMHVIHSSTRVRSQYLTGIHEHWTALFPTYTSPNHMRSHNTQTYKFLYQQRKTMQFIIVVHIRFQLVFYFRWEISLCSAFASTSLRLFTLIQIYFWLAYGSGVLVSATACLPAEPRANNKINEYKRHIWNSWK